MNRGHYTHQRILALHVLVRDWPAVLVDQLKGPTDLGFPRALGRVCDALALHASLFVAKVGNQAAARD